MKLLEDRILKDGVVIGSDILKVDSFLNHRIDVELTEKMADELAGYFANDGATLVLTVEASGIPIACAVARRLSLPVLFAKKSSHKNVGDDLYSCECYSYTHGESYSMAVSRKYLPKGAKVLIIDDFLADGNATNAMMKLVALAEAEVIGIGICIEKGFQNGGKLLREAGIKLRSLAVVDSMEGGKLVFRD